MGDEIEGFEFGRQYLLQVNLEGQTGQIQYGLILETEPDETEKWYKRLSCTIYTNCIKYQFIQWQLKALKASRELEAHSYSISITYDAARCTFIPTLRETLKPSTSALH